MAQQRKDWKDQLREVKREMSTPVTELRNEKEITRAVRYTEEEIQTHLQLGTADTESKVIILQGLLMVVKNIGLGQTKTELSRGIDELLSAISALDAAVTDLLSGAEAQVRELSDEIRKQSGPVLPSLTLAEVEEELKRRALWSETKGQEQEDLQNQCDEKKVRLQVVEQDIRSGASPNEKKKLELEAKQLQVFIGRSEEEIAKLISILSANRREIVVLENCARAIKLVESGWSLPKSLIGRSLE